MGRFFGFIVVIITVAAAGYVFTKQAESVTTAGSNAGTTIDVTAVRNDLLALANAERRFFATNGKYGSLDELRGDIFIPSRPHYSYSAQATDTSFKITAAYLGPDAKAPRSISVDETMSITTD